MIPHRDEHLELCAAYSLGILDPDARAELEAHLESGCETCEAALADFGAAATLVAASARPVALPAGLKARVMSEVRATPQTGAIASDGASVVRDVTPPVHDVTPPARDVTPPARERPRVVEMPGRRVWGYGEWALATAAVLLAVTTLTTWKSAQTLQQELTAKRKEIASLGAQLMEEKRWTEVLAAPNAEAASFAITPAGAKELKARAIYDPASRRAVIVFDNFEAPSGRDYQLWALRGQGVASLGVIHTNGLGHAVMRIDDAGDAKDLGGFAVSLEPTGGSPNPHAPTGPVVMAAKFGG